MKIKNQKIEFVQEGKIQSLGVKIVGFVLLGLVFLGLQASIPPNEVKITHTVSVIHPAIDKLKPIDCYLVEEVLEDGTKRFYLDVDSVNCGENVCKVVVVRMYWDELGRYTTYKLQDDEGLEKKEGAPFTKQDYIKLEKILRNKDSELKSVFKDELVTSDFIDHGNVDVDAVSGATSSVRPEETVEGAVWTCYTLWHWANGGMVSKIRDITSQYLSAKQLRENYLADKNIAYKEFAIEKLIQKKAYDSVTVLELESEAILGEYAVFKMALEYIEQLPKDVYYSAITTLFEKGSYKKRVACLNSVSKTKKGNNKDYYDTLSKKIRDFSYQELEMFLSLLQRNQYTSNTLLEELMPLLKADNFLIARRAFWFLSNQEQVLTKKQKKILKKFKKKNLEKL